MRSVMYASFSYAPLDARPDVRICDATSRNASARGVGAFGAGGSPAAAPDERAGAATGAGAGGDAGEAAAGGSSVVPWHDDDATTRPARRRARVRGAIDGGRQHSASPFRRLVK